MRRETVFGTHFCGNEVSDYGKEHGYVDYATLAKAFDAVLTNNLILETQRVGYWELYNGHDYYYENEKSNWISVEEYEEMTAEEQEKCSDEIYKDIFQYYVISYSGAEILSYYTDEIVFYNETLDMYVWGVTHWGTSWDYVLTEIPINIDEKAFEYDE